MTSSSVFSLVQIESDAREASVCYDHRLKRGRDCVLNVIISLKCYTQAHEIDNEALDWNSSLNILFLAQFVA